MRDLTEGVCAPLTLEIMCWYEYEKQYDTKLIFHTTRSLWKIIPVHQSAQDQFWSVVEPPASFRRLADKLLSSRINIDQ